MSKRQRKRVSREHVKTNAEKGGRGGSDWFKVPDGVGRWQPDKAGRYSIDVLPYEVSTKHHPDEVEKECLWYKYPFQVHHGVGAASDSLVCPRSINKPCPMCEERDRLIKEDSDKHEDVIASLKPQKFVAYNIKSPEDEDRVDIFAMSRGKFTSKLEEELKDPDNEEHMLFFDVNEDGRSLRVRFSESSYEGRKFLEATKIDFKPRDEMDEDKVMSKVVVLEDALIVLAYDELRRVFLQEDEDEGDDEKPSTPPAEEDGDEDDEKQDKPKPKDDDDDDEPEEEEKPKARICPQCKDEYDAEDAEHSDKLDVDFCSRKCLKKAEASAAKKDDDDDEEKPKPSKSSKPKDDDDDDEPEGKPKGEKCKACKGKGKSSKGKKCVPCNGTGYVKPKKKEDDDAEEKPSKGEAAADKKGSSSKTKKGDKDKSTPNCPHDGGKFGQVDRYDECDDCPHWTQCEAASD